MDHICIKYARNPSEGEFERENAVYNVLKKHTSPSPYILQSFFRTPVANFLPYQSGRNLHQLLQRNLIMIHVRNEDGRPQRPRVAGVLRLEPRHLIEQWTAELAAAGAWLESIGYAQGDMRPEDVLLDEVPTPSSSPGLQATTKFHVKLADFDCAEKYGQPHNGGRRAWSRRTRKEALDEIDFDVLGPHTEQFAIWSIIYNLTRGLEPFHHYFEANFGPDAGNMLANGFFPPLRDETDALDNIIRRCWFNLYPSIAELAQETAALPGAEGMAGARALDAGIMAARKHDCLSLFESGLLDKDGALQKCLPRPWRPVARKDPPNSGATSSHR